MAFDTAFNITWNQRVHKEESAALDFLRTRKEKEAANAPPRIADKRSSKRAMSNADLLSEVRSVRESAAGSAVGASRSGRMHRSSSESDVRRGRGSGGSTLQDAGSSTISSPHASRKKAPPMTFEQMQEHVFNQQMNRYIKDLQKEAKEAAVENQWIAQKIKDGMQQQIDEKAKQRRLEEENNRQVQHQIENNKLERASKRKNFVEAASAHNFPLFTETFISQDEVDQYRKDVKINYRKELQQVQQTQQTLKNILVKKDRIYAEEKLSNNIKKMQDDHAHDHHERIRKGNEMMRVWDRDIRLKNIKNAILSGKDATQMVPA